MSSSRDPRERQKDEFEALQSIFSGDIEDKRAKEWMPLDLLITVRSQESLSPDKRCGRKAQLRLHVTCPLDYPYSKPVVTVQDPQGVPPRAVDFLLQELNRVIEEKAGNELIFDLISFVQEFLTPFSVRESEAPAKRKAHRDSVTSQPDDSVSAIPDIQRSAHSRFAEEFELLEKLGTGGFGDVFKARNKLDGQEYAIKKVPINLPEKQHHKIFREVKLLSRLVHENIVRYYSNWIETEGVDGESDDSSTSEAIVRSTIEDPDNSMFCKSLVLAKCSISSNYIQYEESSDGEDSGESESESKPSPTDVSKETNGSRTSFSLKRFMYIQMELCEERTLREWIDDKTLMNDPTLRVRLFREIVEGLAYLHSCLVVHRDLKPGNIFFVKGHAKIGDLGLAISAGKGELLSSEKVGTFHYFAPELDDIRSSDRIRDSTKLDIFSLGITVFEMFYKPVKTGMERHQLLTNLRKSPAEFPSDFRSFPEAEEYEALIIKMISHDPDERPSASELLESSLIPPNDLEDDDKKWIIKQLTSNRAHKDFQKVLDNLFLNTMPQNMIQFHGYDRHSDEGRGDGRRGSVQPQDRRRVSEIVRMALISTFKKFSAVYLTCNTFQLKSQSDAEKFLLIDQKGNIMYPTFSLRESFQRFVSKHHISSLRRYAFEKVYRKSDTCASPLEMTEVAFDVIFQPDNPSVLPELVLLSLISEIVSTVPGFSSRQMCFKLSHNGIFQGVLHYCDFKSTERQKSAISLLSHSEDFCTFDRELRARNLISDTAKAKLVHTVYHLSKESYSDFRDVIKQSLRRKQSSDSKRLADEILAAVTELRIISTILQSVSPCKVQYCGFLPENSDLYSGLVVQLEVMKTGNENPKLLAVGGKYDVKHCDTHSSHSHNSVAGVGVSFEFERLVSLALQEESRSGTLTSVCDVLMTFSVLDVSPEKARILMQECLNLSRFFRKNGLSVLELFEAISPERLASLCRDVKARAAILLANGAENKQEFSCRLFLNEKDRLLEKKMQSYSHRELLDLLKPVHKTDLTSSGDFPSAVDRRTSDAKFQSDSGSSSSASNEKANFMDMHFLKTDNSKLMANQKKRVEMTFSNVFGHLFNASSNHPVLALDIPYKQVKMIANEIDLDDDVCKMRKSLDTACVTLGEKIPRLRKHFPIIMDEILSLKTSSKSPVITLYSYTENRLVTIS